MRWRRPRWSFGVAFILAGLLCAATAAQWVRSYSAVQRIRITLGNSGLEVRSADGVLELSNQYLWDEREVAMRNAMAEFLGKLGDRYVRYRTMDVRVQTPSRDEWNDASAVAAELAREEALLPTRFPAPGVRPIRWQVPYMLLFLATSVPLIVLGVRWDRRRARLRDGLCTRCGYDLRASAGRCPECGAATAAAPANRQP